MDEGRDLTINFPLELLRMSFAYLPVTDLKNARLVTKQWSAAAASVLWSHTKLDVLRSDEHSLDALLSFKPEGLVNNIKALSITSVAPPTSALEDCAFSNLLSVLGALPRDKLVAFDSGLLAISRAILGIVLRTQSQLKILRFCMTETKHNELPGPTYVRGNLGSLQELEISINGNLKHCYEGLVDWFPYTPALQKLYVLGKSQKLNYFNGWILPLQTRPPKLQDLRLKGLYLAHIHESLEWLDLSTLERLEIEDCLKAGHLLHALAERYKEAGSSALAFFKLTSPKVSGNAQRACEELFRSVKTLKKVTIGASAGPLPDPASLQNSSRSLEHLNIYGDKAFYSPTGFEKLVTNCPHLDVLEISLEDLKHTIDRLAPFEPYETSTSGDLEESLAVLSRHPNLSTLIVNSRPLLSQNKYEGARRWRYAQVAEQILGYLVKCGSNINYLGFEPHGVVHCDGEVDEDGHIWPDYFYRKGTVSIPKKSGTEVIRTIAIPWPK